jgi:hypothetical protein
LRAIEQNITPIIKTTTAETIMIIRIIFVGCSDRFPTTKRRKAFDVLIDELAEVLRVEISGDVAMPIFHANVA